MVLGRRATPPLPASASPDSPHEGAKRAGASLPAAPARSNASRAYLDAAQPRETLMLRTGPHGGRRSFRDVSGVAEARCGASPCRVTSRRRARQQREQDAADSTSPRARALSRRSSLRRPPATSVSGRAADDEVPEERALFSRVARRDALGVREQQVVPKRALLRGADPVGVQDRPAAHAGRHQHGRPRSTEGGADAITCRRPRLCRRCVSRERSAPPATLPRLTRTRPPPGAEVRVACAARHRHDRRRDLPRRSRQNEGLRAVSTVRDLGAEVGVEVAAK